MKDRFECVNVDVERTPHKKIPINELNCTSAGGTWQVSKSFGDHAPECRSHQHSRQNHLGNVATSQDGFLKNLPETAHFDWYVHVVVRLKTKKKKSQIILTITGQFQRFQVVSKTLLRVCFAFDTIYLQTITEMMRRGVRTWVLM